MHLFLGLDALLSTHAAPLHDVHVTHAPTTYFPYERYESSILNDSSSTTVIGVSDG